MAKKKIEPLVVKSKVRELVKNMRFSEEFFTALDEKVAELVEAAVLGGCALLWVFIGSIMMGAVHDFGSLLISMRNKGKSISEYTAMYVSSRTRLIIFFVMAGSGLVGLASNHTRSGIKTLLSKIVRRYT